MSGERTEEATPKRIRDAQKRGQVPKSREFTSAATFIVLAAYLYLASEYYIYEMQQMVLLSREFYDVDIGVDSYYMLFRIAIHAIRVIYPVLAIVLVVGLAANVAHIGIIFSAEVIKPKLSNLDMIGGLKRIFSKSNFFEFLKSTIKISILGYIIYTVVRGSIKVLIISPSCGLSCVIGLLESLIARILSYTCGVFVIVAAFDLFFQRMQYFNRLKMTKEEVKQEYKETEGDPLIKGQRQQLHQELVAQQIEQATEDSTAVVVNPVHLAVAFSYNAEDEKLPVITAKGRGAIAQIIVRTAKRRNIPIFRNVYLAQSLYQFANVGNYIPRNLIKPIAEIIRWVNQMRQQEKYK